MSEKVSTESGCAAARKPWSTPKVIVTAEASGTNKDIPDITENHNSSPNTAQSGS
ncbi:MAG TPA: hypothetical protein VII56_02970 [Rhizomicrobium sp.]